MMTVKASGSYCRSWIILVVLSGVLAACGKQPQVEPLPEDGVILAFGDSLTWGTGTSPENSYPQVLARLTGLQVINGGVPGEITREGLTRLPGLLQAHKPDLVILCHGGNDILRQLPATETQANLARMIELIRAGGAHVVLLGVPDFSLLPSTADFYDEVAGQFNLPYQADIITELERDPSVKSDRIHFNQAGYQRLAEAIFDLLVESGFSR